MFAIVSRKGSQYKLEPDQKYRIDQVDGEENKIVFDQVLLISEENKTVVGSPVIKNATVEAEICSTIRTPKVRVFKFRAKKRYQRQHNHKQTYSVIKVIKINNET